MKMKWDRPGYDPHCSSCEERRGAVPVRPSEVVPYTLSLDYEAGTVSQSTFFWSSIRRSDHLSDVDDELDGTMSQSMFPYSSIRGGYHLSDSTDNELDCGYSTDSTMTWQPHTSIRDRFPAHSVGPVSRSDGVDGASRFASDVESDDEYVLVYFMSMRHSGFGLAFSRSTKRHVSQQIFGDVTPPSDDEADNG
jgi:hypothetical protein